MQTIAFLLTSLLLHNTSEMIHHRGASLSKQQTTDLLAHTDRICHCLLVHERNKTKLMTHKYPIDLEISPIARLVWTPDPSGQKGLGSRL